MLKNKILIVDDSVLIRNVLKMAIAEEYTYEVVVCQNLQQTKELLENDLDFFVSILDLDLPDAKHGEVVDYVTKKGIPSIVLTGNMDSEVRKKILSYKIVDYFLKKNKTELKHVVSLIDRLRKNPDIKILVVDDSKSYRYYLVNLLKIHTFQVLEASDGVEALQVLEENRGQITMVITDYQMANMNGIELTEAIRREYTRTELCVIAISSQSSSNLSATFLKAGANDIISKSFLVEELYSRINNNIDTIEYIRQIEDMTLVDQMTGLYNRRHLFTAGNRLFSDAKKNSDPLAIAILDVDFFKKVNDTYGHEVGDMALKSVAKVMKDKSHDTDDIVVRFGGEEFSILFSSSIYPEQFFEELREAVENMEVVLEDGTKLKITISIGLANVLEGTLEETLRSADMALYQAKLNGRNQVVSSSSQSTSRSVISSRIRARIRDKK